MKSMFMNREIFKVYKIRFCPIIENFKIDHKRKSKNIDEHSYPFRKQSVQCLKYLHTHLHIGITELSINCNTFNLTGIYA